MGLFSNQRDLGQKFEQVRVNERGGDHRLDIWGGNVSVKVITLKVLYKEHMHKRNIWTASNEGYDLARYFGTTMYLYPHATTDYVFWWETDWNEPLQTDTINLAPGIVLNSKHKRIIRSRKNGRHRPKKIYIRPPSNLKTEWYFQKNWENVILFRMGLTTINFETPFLHNREDTYGTWIGWAYKPHDNTHIKGPPKKPLNWDATDMDKNNFKNGDMLIPVYYKFWWDTGEDNAIMINQDSRTMNSSQPPSKIVPINIPYWQFFYGQNSLTAQQNSKHTDFRTNPSIYAVWWYKDYGTSYKSGQRYVPTPNEIPHSPYSVNFERGWVLLTGENIEAMEGGPSNNETDKTADNLVTFRTVQTVLRGITSKGPFATAAADIDGPNVVNIPLRYTSHWQWGGVGPTSATVRDPIPGQVTARVRIEDPGQTIDTALHPWDFHASGILTSAKLKRLLSLETDTPFPDGLPKKSLESDEEPSQEEEELSGEDSTTSLKAQIQATTQTDLKQLLGALYERVRNGELERGRLKKVFKHILK